LLYFATFACSLPDSRRACPTAVSADRQAGADRFVVFF